MKPIVTVGRDDVVGKMFPHRMKLYYVRTTLSGEGFLDMEEVTENFLLGDVPCSVQNATTVKGEVIDTEYVILSPCLDLSAVEEAGGDVEHESYRLEVTMNGRVNIAEGPEIAEVDNTCVGDMEGFKIGCCIRVKLNAATWLFGR